MAGGFEVRIEPGAHVLEVGPDENILAAGLAAGIPLPHSCRAGRCASCKAQIVSGAIQYPGDQLPPGIAPVEAARGEVLLCQARPRSALVVRARISGLPTLPTNTNAARVLTTASLPSGELRLTLELAAPRANLRPGQFVDLANERGEAERGTLVAIQGKALDVEFAGLAANDWLRGIVGGESLDLAGPFDRPR
jgi:CDP-4-dehydro-6-deoxyglucose reductase, E3